MVYPPATGRSPARTSSTATSSASADRIVGYECDGLDFVTRNGLPYPTGKDGTPRTTEILALAPSSSASGRPRSAR